MINSNRNRGDNDVKAGKIDNILETVNTKGTITVKEIMTRLDVSDMTARRYLQELADKDLLVRVHGGAEKIRTGSILIMTFQY